MNKNKILIRFVLFALSLLLYWNTMSPTVSFIDSGELAGVCSTLGVSHPSGYPLFTILGFLWTKLAFGISKIAMLNFLAGLYVAGAVVFFYEILAAANLRLAKTKTEFDFVAIAGGLTFATALTVWQQATSIEVYSLHLLMLNATIFYFITGIWAADKKRVLLSAFLLGLSFTNHLTTILLLPAIAYYYFMGNKNRVENVFTLKFFGQCLLFALVSLSLYLYLPLRSATGAEFNWGEVHRGLSKFLYHAQGKQYQVWMFTGSEAWAGNFEKFTQAAPFQFGLIGLVFILFGAYHLIRRDARFLNFLLFLVFTCIFYSFNYSINDIESYFLLAFIGLLIMAFIGLRFSLNIFKFRLPSYVALLLPLLNLTYNYAECDRSKEYYVYDYMQTVFNCADKGGIIISSQWDFWLSASWYYQRVEGLRPDLVIIDKELVRRTWYPNQLMRWYPVLRSSQPELDKFMVHLENFEEEKDYDPIQIQATYTELLNSFVVKNFEKRPIYFTLETLQSTTLPKGYTFVPQGFLFKVIKAAEVDSSNFADFDLAKLKLDRFKSIAIDPDGYVGKIHALAAVNLANEANYLQIFGSKEKAFTLAKKALAMDSTNSAARDILSKGL